MLSSKIIKETSRNYLRGRWATVCVLVVILLAVVFVPILLGELVLGVFRSAMFNQNGAYTLLGVFIASAIILASFVLSVPVIQGAVRWFWALIIDSELPISELFYYYSSPRLLTNTLLLYIRVLFRYIVTAVVCFAPSVFGWLIVKGYIKNIVGYSIVLPSVVIKSAVVVLGIIGILLFLMFAFKTSLSMVLVVIDEQLYYVDALKLSKKISAKKGFVIAITILSYFGWLLLSALGITMLYTLPFLLCSYVTAARFSITNYRINNKLTDEKIN